jgi:hypothetical protein
VNFRTWYGVFASAAIGAAGLFASTFVVGGLWLLFYKRETKALAAERVEREKEWQRVEIEAKRQIAEEQAAALGLKADAAPMPRAAQPDAERAL